MSRDVTRTAMALAFDGQRSPLVFERNADDAIVPMVQRLAPTASADECLAAVRRVRALCDSAYRVADELRAGYFGAGPDAPAAACRALAAAHEWMTETECGEALAAGMMWTA
jgi:hypothetical protein